MRLSIEINLPALRERVATFAKAGAEGVTLAIKPSAVAELGATARRDVEHTIRSRGLTPAAVRVTLPGKGLAAGFDADRVLDGLRRALGFARDSGFATLACDLGALPRTVETARPQPKRADAGLLILPTADDIARVAGEADAEAKPLSAAEREHGDAVDEVLRAIGAAADPIAVPIAFGASIADTAALSAALVRADAPLFLRELDPAGAASELAADVDAVVMRPPPILHVLATDAQVSGSRARPADLGAGDVPWPDLLAALRDSDFAGWLAARDVADLERLRRLLD